MLLQNGVYKDKQIVPADYVNRMHSEWVDTTSKNDDETRGGYGYEGWKCIPPNTYRADGMYGQLCVVLTDATRGNAKDDYGDKVNRIIFERTDSNSVKNALSGEYFDVVYDKIAYCLVWNNNLDEMI